MGRIRFHAPIVDRIPISDGDWIEVKHKLNNGDQKRLESAGLKPPMVVGGKIISPIDWEVYEIHRAMIFLTAWSLHGPDDKPIDITVDALRALDTDSFEEINRAIYRHIAQVTAEELTKKGPQEATKTGSESGAAEGQTPTLPMIQLPSEKSSDDAPTS